MVFDGPKNNPIGKMVSDVNRMDSASVSSQFWWYDAPISMHVTVNTNTNISNSAHNLKKFFIWPIVDRFLVAVNRELDIEYSLMLTSNPNENLLMAQRNNSPTTNINVIGECNFPVIINCSSSKKHIVQNITMKCDKMTWTNGNVAGTIGLFRATIFADFCG